jgi:hypothetical protein
MVRPLAGIWVGIKVGDTIKVVSDGAHDPITIRVSEVFQSPYLETLINSRTYLHVCPNAASPRAAKHAIASSLAKHLHSEGCEYVLLRFDVITHNTSEAASPSRA